MLNGLRGNQTRGNEGDEYRVVNIIKIYNIFIIEKNIITENNEKLNISKNKYYDVSIIKSIKIKKK